MDRELWRRVNELFERALERPEAERETFLREIGGDDREVRDEVASLLAAHREDEFLAEPAPAKLAITGVGDEETSDPLLGRTIGSWRLVREIGHGGMGTVYEGRRTGDEFDQRVAVKLLASGLFGAAAFRERFVAERRILAGLEHENIARLLDGGTTPDGLPYFVMEYVQGSPIDRYCEEHELSVKERLELMLRACAAVSTAHQKLVVHRDLKPGNILVTESGIPKLLDFGIAKLLEPDGAAAVTQWTVAGARPMTPGYASPEQVAGEPVTVASDVYSLGVLLYELLTGQLPHPANTTGEGATARNSTATTEPRKPSAAVGREPRNTAEGGSGQATGPPIRARGASPERLRRQLAGDLDNILLEALDPEPERRYASVRDLEDDLRRHLDGRPVAARSPSLPYRAAKFVRRNRLALAVAAVFAVLASGLLALSVRYTVDLERERNAALAARELAERQELEARELADFLVELFQAPDPDRTRGATVTARELLEAGAERIERELASQPLTRARLLETIGRVNISLGLFSDAEPLLERSLELRQEHAADQPLLLASSFTALGFLASERRFFPEALQLYRRAVELQRSVLGNDDPAVAGSLQQIAALLRYDPNSLEEADALSREALDILQRRLTAEDRRVLSAMNVRAGILAARGDGGAAEQLYLELLDRQRSALGADHPALAMTYNNLGFLYRRQERLEEALTAYQRSQALQVPAFGADHPNTVRLWLNLASVLSDLGKPDETEAILRRVVDIRRAASPPEPIALSNSLVHGLGHFLLLERRWADALKIVQEGIAVRKAAGEPDPFLVALDRGFLAAALIGAGDPSGGDRSAQEALAVLSSESLPNSVASRVRQIVKHLAAAGSPQLASQFRALLDADS